MQTKMQSLAKKTQARLTKTVLLVLEIVMYVALINDVGFLITALIDRKIIFENRTRAINFVMLIRKVVIDAVLIGVLRLLRVQAVSSA